MSFLQNLTIKARLISMVAMAAVFMVLIGVTGLTGMQSANDGLEELYRSGVVQTERVNRIIELLGSARSQVLLGLQHDPDSKFANMHDHPLSLHTGAIDRAQGQIEDLWSRFRGQDMPEEERRMAEGLERSLNELFDQGIEAARKSLESGAYAKANEILLTVINPGYEQAMKDSEALKSLQLEEGGRAHEAAAGELTQTTSWVVALLVIATALSGAMALMTIAGIGRAVRDLDAAANKLAEGDLGARIQCHGDNELSHIGDAFNRMAERFQGAMQEIGGAIGQLAAAAEQTSRVTAQTTSGIQQQRMETEQVATAMNEMNATVHEVAQNASSASEAAREADTSSNKGKEVVERTVDAIQRLAGEVDRASEVIHDLERESENIGTVLDVIRGIAEQTNLLALNAAIEAARAGEKGRGFAVVADEVRTLASRTQQSTQEIQDMISRLQSGATNAVQVMEAGRQQAQAGVEQAAEAGSALAIITTAVDRITDMNTQIATAAEEQSAVAEEINRNIVSISQVAEQTAQGADQTASASQDLANLAAQLQGLVGQFRV